MPQRRVLLFVADRRASVLEDGRTGWDVPRIAARIVVSVIKAARSSVQLKG